MGFGWSVGSKMGGLSEEKDFVLLRTGTNAFGGVMTLRRVPDDEKWYIFAIISLVALDDTSVFIGSPE